MSEYGIKILTEYLEDIAKMTKDDYDEIYTLVREKEDRRVILNLLAVAEPPITVQYDPCGTYGNLYSSLIAEQVQTELISKLTFEDTWEIDWTTGPILSGLSEFSDLLSKSFEDVDVIQKHYPLAA